MSGHGVILNEIRMKAVGRLNAHPRRAVPPGQPANESTLLRMMLQAGRAWQRPAPVRQNRHQNASEVIRHRQNKTRGKIYHELVRLGTGQMHVGHARQAARFFRGAAIALLHKPLRELERLQTSTGKSQDPIQTHTE